MDGSDTGGPRDQPQRGAGALRRWWGKQVARPRYDTGAATSLALTAADGTRLHAVRLPARTGAPLASVVVVHGLTNSGRTPNVQGFAVHASRWASVVVVDLRGHGRSGGSSTLGEHEALDVAAAVAAAHDADPERPVVVVGTSLGGLAAVKAAAQPGGAPIAGVYSLSAPARSAFDGPAAARMHRLCSTAAGRAVLRTAFRTRLRPGWWDPDDLVAELPGATAGFTVVVHDPADRWFGPEHAEAIHDRVPSPKALWWVPGAGHGVDLLTDELAARIEGDLRERV